MKILLDTNFIITSTKNKLDFPSLAEEIIPQKIEWILPQDVLNELGNLKDRKGTKEKDKAAAKLGFDIIQSLNPEVIELPGKNPNVDIKIELKNITVLFTKTVEYLNEIFILHKDNKLLIKLLLDNKKPIEDIFYKGAQKIILEKMFDNGIDDALLYTADKMRQNGWHKDSDKYLKKVGLNN